MPENDITAAFFAFCPFKNRARSKNTILSGLSGHWNTDRNGNYPNTISQWISFFVFLFVVHTYVVDAVVVENFQSNLFLLK